MSDKRFYFDTDDSGHDYLVPLELKEDFQNMSEDCYKDRTGMNFEAIENFEDKFGSMRIGESITRYSFTDPRSG